MTDTPRVAVVGEPLAELRPVNADVLDLSYSGDALNVAVRLAQGGVSVEFVSAVGTDRFSNELVRRLHAVGVATTSLVRSEDHPIGMYLVETDARGERRFTYWRSASPARHVVDLVGLEALARIFDSVDAVVVSGIGLAVLDDRQRHALVSLLAAASSRRTTVVFDPNVRLGLWGSTDEARRWIDAAVGVADIVKTSTEDLGLLDVDAREWAAVVPELVVTDGAGATWWWEGPRHGVVPVAPATVVDTTGAGDAFDAAYLAARLGGSAVVAAIEAGHAGAATAVSHPGGLQWGS